VGFCSKTSLFKIVLLIHFITFSFISGVILTPLSSEECKEKIIYSKSKGVN